MNATELFDSEGKSTGFFICGKCRMVTLNPLFSFRNGEPKNTQAAAELCCRDPVCSTCKKEFKAISWREEPICDECRNAKWKEKAAADARQRVEKANEIPAESYDGMIFHDGGDNWFDSIEDLCEQIEPENWPEFVFCAVPEIRQLDLKEAIESQLERLCEDGYEDMDIEPDKELLDAVDAFNERTKSELTCWTVDYSRKIRVPKDVACEDEK